MILVGELRPTCSNHHGKGWLPSESGQGLTSTLVPIDTDACDASSTHPFTMGFGLGLRTRGPVAATGSRGLSPRRRLGPLPPGHIDHTLDELLVARADGQPVKMP